MESNLTVSRGGRKEERGDWLFFQQQPLAGNSNRTYYSTETSGGNPQQADGSLDWGGPDLDIAGVSCACQAAMTVQSLWANSVVLYKFRD